MEEGAIGGAGEEVAEDGAGVRGDVERIELIGGEVAERLPFVYGDFVFGDIGIDGVDVVEVGERSGKVGLAAVEAEEAEAGKVLAGLFLELAEGGGIGGFAGLDDAAGDRPLAGVPLGRQVGIAELEEEASPARFR